jgi:hypothetical protein
MVEVCEQASDLIQPPAYTANDFVHDLLEANLFCWIRKPSNVALLVLWRVELLLQPSKIAIANGNTDRVEMFE